MDITIGQDSKPVTFIEGQLEADGAKVLITYINTQLPWTSLPIISTFVNLIISETIKLFITQIDNIAFAAFVSIKTGIQVDTYVKSKKTNDKTAIDNAADSLIHLKGM